MFYRTVFILFFFKFPLLASVTCKKPRLSPESFAIENVLNNTKNSFDHYTKNPTQESLAQLSNDIDKMLERTQEFIESTRAVDQEYDDRLPDLFKIFEITDEYCSISRDHYKERSINISSIIQELRREVLRRDKTLF